MSAQWSKRLWQCYFDSALLSDCTRRVSRINRSFDLPIATIVAFELSSHQTPLTPIDI